MSSGAGSVREQTPWDAFATSSQRQKRPHEGRAPARHLDTVFVGGPDPKRARAHETTEGHKRLARDLRCQRGASAYQSRRVAETNPFHVEVDLAVMMSGLAVSSSRPASLVAPPVPSRLQPIRALKQPTPPTTQTQPTALGGTSIADAAAIVVVSVEATTLDQKDEWGVPRVRAGPRPPMHTSRGGFAMVAPLDLYDHQVRAITEGRNHELNPHRGTRGKIWAMEMGLGKTLSSSALVAMDRVENPGVGPTLVIMSLSLILGWIDDLHKFYHDTIRILVLRKDYLGEDRYRSLTREQVESFDLVLTTYEVVVYVAKDLGLVESTTDKKARKRAERLERMDPFSEAAASKPKDAEEKVKIPRDRGSGLLFGLEWHRIIADESQRFSTPTSLVFQAMMELQSKYRLCLTGTPYRNYASDLWAQFCFLGYDGTPDKRDWTVERYAEHDMGRCVMVMTYDDARVTLPPKESHDVYFTLDGLELLVYNLFLHVGTQSLQRSRSDALVILGYLRQACIAPFLTAPRATVTLTGHDNPTDPKRRDELAKDPNLRPFNEEMHRVGETSPLFWSLGAFCTRSDLLAAIETVYGKMPDTDRVGMFPPETKTPIERAAFLEAWWIDWTGTAGVHSGKMRRTSEALDVMARQERKKILVFSSYERSLRLLGRSLEGRGWTSQHFSIVTGSCTGDDRKAEFDRFRTSPDCCVLMMTYKVGSVGLNLTAATRVVHLETWWNNVEERQADARAWRIGQTEPVHCYHIMIQNSIEERMLRLCDDKFQEEETLLGMSATEREAAMRQADVQMLPGILTSSPALVATRTGDD